MLRNRRTTVFPIVKGSCLPGNGSRKRESKPIEDLGIGALESDHERLIVWSRCTRKHTCFLVLLVNPLLTKALICSALFAERVAEFLESNKVREGFNHGTRQRRIGNALQFEYEILCCD